MSVTTANIKGSNIKRLVIEQLGSNLSSATLTQPLIDDAESEKYDVQIEDFWIRSDVPIIETDTTVFSIFDRGVVDEETPVAGDEIETCVVGPVYNWMDLCSQIAKFLTIFSNGGVFVGIETHYMMQKKISFVGNLLFWQNYYIQLTPKFAEIFDKKREEGLVENVYLLYQTSDAQGAPVPGPLFKPNPPPLDAENDSPYLFNLPQTVAFPPPTLSLRL